MSSRNPHRGGVEIRLAGMLKGGPAALMPTPPFSEVKLALLKLA
jgi:hypothetical protein